jgi:thioredoxin reductase (NADPH)
MGPDLIMNMKKQAERFGAKFSYDHVTGFEQIDNGFKLIAGDKSLETRCLIIASGASARWLGLPGEKKLIGHGLTSCATCDGAFYRDVPVCVIGGGDSACEEATFLTRFASKVYLIHRRDTLRAQPIMADRALNNAKIEPVWNTVVTEYLTDDEGEMRGVKLHNRQSGEESELEVKCVFVAIGHNPNTEAFQGLLDMDEEGYLLRTQGMQTNIPGVFCAGDVTDKVYRQAVTAAGHGCAAALEAEHYLGEFEI